MSAKMMRMGLEPMSKPTKDVGLL